MDYLNRSSWSEPTVLPPESLFFVAPFPFSFISRKGTLGAANGCSVCRMGRFVARLANLRQPIRQNRHRCGVESFAIKRIVYVQRVDQKRQLVCCIFNDL